MGQGELFRFLFLEKFTEEVVRNIFREREAKLEIEAEKIKKKVMPSYKLKEELTKPIESKIKGSSLYQKNRFESVPKNRLARKGKILGFLEPVLRKKVERIKTKKESRVPVYTNTEYLQKSGDLNAGKLESLLRDSLIQTIECPGPGRNILVKKLNKVYVTKVVLSREEIDAIINEFADRARIPVEGGILKAAVGDLMISAVLSDFVGSRFILSRLSLNF